MIWLTQWLCPQRHCSIALLWDDGQDRAPAIVVRGEEVYARRTVNRWCGICGSRELRPEAGRTIFQTMAEAVPAFDVLQAANLHSRQWLQGGRN